MIRYLRHTEIDTEKWDRCIDRSVNGLIYARPWYLDTVSPGWEALVEDDYASVFPLTWASRCGVRYLRQPFFTQQLGLFSERPLSQETVTAFLDAIPPRYRFAEIHLNSFNKVDAARFSAEIRRNHEMELVRNYDAIAAGYSQNTRRNIRKATENGLSVRRKITPDELVTLFRENFGRKERKLSYRDYVTIGDLMNRSLKNASGILMGAGAGEAPPDAGAFFLADRNRFIFLFSASNMKTRDNGAMFLLIDTFIREHSGRALILDFEGGHDPNLGRFYKSFGASETGYPAVRINRFPPFFKAGLSLYKKLKSR